MVKSNGEQKTKTGHTKKSVAGKNMKSVGTVKYLFVAVLVLVVLLAGINIYKVMPQVSDQTISTLGAAYYKDIESLDAELNLKYQECFVAKDLDGWKQFSEAWIPRIGEKKPEQFMKRLSKKSGRLVTDFDYLSKELFQIWTVYNASMESGNPIEEAEAKTLMDSIVSAKTSISSQLE